MLLNVTCKKCGMSYKMDIGNRTKEETITVLKKQKTFSCKPGHHEEISSPVNFLTFGEIETGSAPTDDEWLSEQTKNGTVLMATDQVREKYTCTGFSAGLFVGYRNDDKTRKTVYLDYTHSPSGKRYYYGEF